MPHEVYGVLDVQHGAGKFGGARLPVRGVADQSLLDLGRFALFGFVELATDDIPYGKIDHLRQVPGPEGPTAQQAKCQLLGRAGADDG
ncbi:hypothetical protein [Streptomyces sp. NPDC058861]|uniref:hypothetical protein n=1 Tax=Streptomyces sp. NPDC058861 TaxID=3346653 RepID=UPI0036B6B03F